MKTIILSVFVISASLVIAFLVITNDGVSGAPTNTNVTMENGRQIITIGARGGYSPRVTIAKAGVPTTIKMSSKGTFDCSAALVIPSLNYQNFLPATGETLIDIPPQEAGSTLQGLCAMGMYGFTIKFD